MSREPAPALFPLFRSRLQGELLAHVFMRPDKERTASEIAEAVNAPLSSVSRELDRLVGAGLLEERRLGRARLITVNADAPILGPATELVLHSFGPRFVVAEEFRDVPGVDEVWIFGSWAARHAGRSGPPPADIDVLVVGRPDRSAMYDAAQRAETRLGKPVNTTVRSRHTWQDAPDNFVERLRAGPLLRVAPTDKAET